MMDGAKTNRDRESLKQTVRVKSQISIEIYMSKFTLTYVYVHICVRITESFRANGFPKSSTPTWDGRSRRQSIKACINVFEKPTQVIWKINIWHPDDAATNFHQKPEIAWKFAWHLLHSPTTSKLYWCSDGLALKSQIWKHTFAIFENRTLSCFCLCIVQLLLLEHWSG